VHKYLDVTYKYQFLSDYPMRLSVWLYVHYIKPKSKLLDLGCGTGDYTDMFKNLGLEVISLDKYSLKADHLIDFERYKFPLKDNSVDTVFCKSVIEHIHNIEHVMDEIYRVLKPGGRVIIMTPDWETNMKGFYIDFSHVSPFTLKALREMLLIFHFGEVECKKFYQLPLLWEFPWLTSLAKITAKLIPDCFKWRDKDQTIQNTWIRYSKEIMLLGIGEK